MRIAPFLVVPGSAGTNSIIDLPQSMINFPNAPDFVQMFLLICPDCCLLIHEAQYIGFARTLVALNFACIFDLV